MIFPGTQKGSGSGEDNLNPLLPKPFAFQGFFNRKKIKVRNHLYQRLRTFVVPKVGLEPTRGISPADFESATSANSIISA